MSHRASSPLPFHTAVRTTDPWRRSDEGQISARTPLVIPALVFAVALGLGASWPTKVTLAVTVVTLASAALTALRPTAKGRWSSLWVVPPLMIGLHLPVGVSTPTLPPGPHRVTATVASPPRAVANRHEGPLRQRMTLRFETVDGRPQVARVAFHAPTISLGRGDRIKFVYWHDPARAVQRVGHPTHVHSVEPSVLGGLDRKRHELRASWSWRFSAPVAAWFSTLLLGERAAIDDSTRRRFRDLGQSHLLAISGLHVGIIATLAAFALGRVGRLRTVYQRLLIAMLLVVYAGLAGADPAVVRATVLGGLATIAILRRRAGDSLNALCCSFILLTVALPEQATELGFILTFSAVLGIVLLGTSRTRHPVLRRNLVQHLSNRVQRALRISCAAWIGAAIPLALVKPDVTLWAPLFAIVLTPLVATLLGLGLLAVCPSPLDAVIDRLARGVIWMLDATSQQLDELPGTPSLWPPLPAVSIVLGLLSIAFYWHGTRTRWPAVVTLAVAVAMASIPRRLPCLVTTSVGRGQAVLIATQRATLLADAGSVDRSAGGADTIVGELWRLGRTRIDLIVLSHPHADHVLAIPELVQRVSVARVWVSAEFGSVPLGATILRQLERAGVPWETVSRGDRATLGDLELDVVYPDFEIPRALRLSTNDSSIVLRAQHVSTDLAVVIPGDSESFALARSAPRLTKTPIVILPHHGRSIEGLEAWIETIDPDVLIGSNVGVAEPQIEALRKTRTALLTSELGHIRVTHTSHGWRLEARRPGWKSLGVWSTVRSP